MDAIVPTNSISTIESLLIQGDLSKLTAEQRVAYYMSVCKSLGLNHLTKPFDYIVLNGRLTLYAKRDCTDQLRRINHVSVTKLEQSTNAGVYTVTAYGTDAEGRQDSSTGAVFIENLKGDALANAIMKAETKAKRRLTLSLCGLGWLDETEVDTVREAAPVVVTTEGEIVKAEPVKVQTPKTNGKTTPNPVGALVEAGIAENAHEAAAIVNLSPFPKGNMTIEALVAWGKLYRGWRDLGQETKEAASKASAGEVPQ